MTRRFTLLAAILTLGLFASNAMAQYPLPYGDDDLNYAPAVSLYPERDERPAANYYAPATNLYAPATNLYAAPAATSVYAPVAPAYGSTTSGLVTTYAPAAPAVYAPATYAAQPMVAPTVMAPSVTYRPGWTTYTPVTYRPVVAPNYAAPMTYTPVVNRTVMTPVTYTPAVAPACPIPQAAAPVAVATGPRVWVHEKVYVEGQPIRNLLKAITP